MKLVYVTSSAPYGNGESFVISEVNAVASLGHEITVFPMWRRTAKIKRGFAHETIRTRFVRSLSVPAIRATIRYFLRAPRPAARLLVSILDLNPRHFLVNLLAFPRGVLIAEFAASSMVDHIHCHWMTSSATAAMVASNICGVPWSMSVHRGDIVDANLQSKKVETAAFVRLISFASARLFSASALTHQHKFRVLHMGAEMPVLTLKRRHDRSGRKFTIITPANLIAVKGHEFLVRAIAKLPGEDLVLLLAGEGALRSALGRLVTSLGQSHRIQFMGQVAHSDLMQLYQSGGVDLVVLPSLDLGNGLHEGIPVALVEAMANCIPVVSTATGSIPELVDNSCGTLVGHMDSEQLAAAILRYMKSSELCREHGMRGRRKVEREFNIDVVSRELVSLFAEHSSRGG